MRPKPRKRDYTPAARGPLEHVRILDLSRLFAGNLLTQVLGDFGAEVIKIEPPERRYASGALGARTASRHTGKFTRATRKSLCLDLAQAGNPARCCARASFPTANMLIESFRPGILEKMGPRARFIARAQSQAWSSSAFRGWGQGTDPTVSVPASVRSSKGYPALPPSTASPTERAGAGRRCISPMAWPASTGAAAAMIALREVESNGGAGQVIDPAVCSIRCFAILSPQAANYRLTGQGQAGGTGSRSTNSAPAQCLQVQGTANMWGCRPRSRRWPSASSARSDVPDLIDDRRYRSNADRVKNGRRPRCESSAPSLRSGRKPRMSHSSKPPDVTHRADL